MAPGFSSRPTSYSRRFTSSLTTAPPARQAAVEGKHQELETEGLLAIAIQREIDHLDGKLFIDRLSEIKRSMIKGKIFKRGGKDFERSRFKVEL